MYWVVEKIEDGESFCSAVPTSWVQNGVLTYPKRRGQWNISRRNNIAPQDGWPCMPCKLLIDHPISKNIS